MQKLFKYIPLIFVLSSGICWSKQRLQQKLKIYSRADLEKQGVIDSFYDVDYDYSKFTGRVTDRDKTGNVFKISSENKNVKFFRSGDTVKFRMASKTTKLCEGYVRSVEKGFFVIYVKDIYPCWKGGEYFRRGTMLFFETDALSARVRDASIYRIVLLKRRRDFLNQLNGVNHFIWSYDQQRQITAAEYDKKINEIQAGKQRAIELLLVKKKDSVNLQKELAYRLDALDKDLEFYRIEKDDLLYDRWHLDHDLGRPVGRRPQRSKYVKPQ